jgi:hypothetical protein
MADNNKKSFFTTLPGILTGLAALIAAITSLYLALKPPTEKPPVQPEPSVQQETTIQPEQGWCCIENKVIELTEKQCIERGGKFFISSIEAEKNCPPSEQPELGWCCIKGEILRLTQEACRQRGGAFFLHREKAEEHCRPPEEGWCSLEGKVMITSREECLKRSGEFFTNAEAAEEHRQLHEPGYCCIDGDIREMIKKDCIHQGGQFFVSREEAEMHCRREPEVSFRVIPKRARRGQQVELHLSAPLENFRVIYRGRELPKKAEEEGRILLVRVPEDAVSGSYFELEWDGKHIRAPEPLIIIELPVLHPLSG